MNATPRLHRSFSAAWSRDLLLMTKPRIGLMVGLVTFLGYRWAGVDHGAAHLLHTVVGVLLLAGASSVLNQVLERDLDARMERTRGRPLPAGRLRVSHAVIFGIGISVLGAVELGWFVGSLTSLLTVATLLAYLLVYTPLKTRTHLNTLVGAVPGAMPPLIGWAAATGSLDLHAAILFGLLFLWQLPHFLAIAWLYRDDYRAGGFRMLSRDDADGSLTARQMLLQSLGLLALSLFPVALDQSGGGYGVAALIGGTLLVAGSLWFSRTRTDRAARSVLSISLVYLPVLLCLLSFSR